MLMQVKSDLELKKKKKEKKVLPAGNIPRRLAC